MSTQIHEERIVETAVGELFGVRIGATAGRVDEYPLPSGEKSSGPTMLLCFLVDDVDVRVGEGSEIEAGGKTWTVTHVHLAKGGQGWVDLETQRAADVVLVQANTLDFLFEEECDDCGGRSGWDGTTDQNFGKLAIGLQCTECTTKVWMTDGSVQRAFFEGPPVFTPGRRL